LPQDLQEAIAGLEKAVVALADDKSLEGKIFENTQTLVKTALSKSAVQVGMPIAAD
jgi:hypothetical protein